MNDQADVCDLCNSATGVRWAWTTPNPTETLEEAQERGLLWFEDPVWHICDTCHRMILAGKRESILDRALASVAGQILLTFKDGAAHKIDAMQHITSTHEAFWLHKESFEEVR